MVHTSFPVRDAEANALVYVLALEKQYDKAIDAINNEIFRFYGKYAGREGLTLEAVKKLLNPAELKTYKEQTELYYREVMALGLSDEEVLKYLKELSAKSYMSRLEALKAYLRHECEKLAALEEAALGKALADEYIEASLKATYDIQLSAGEGTPFTVINDKTAAQAVKTPWVGANYSDRIWKRKTALTQTLNRLVPQAIIAGRSPNELGEQIAKELNVSLNSGVRLARTEFLHAVNEASFEAFEESGVSDSYQFLCDLSSRTCEKCGALDLEIFKNSEKETGVNFPQIHPRCRCTYIPYFDDMDVTDRIAYTPDHRRYSVPSNMSYKEWKQKYGQNGGDNDIIGMETSNGIVIKSVSAHSHDRSAERNVSNDAIIDAITNPLFIGDVRIGKDGKPSQRFIGENATVNVNSATGNIATVWRTGSAAKKKYSRKGE